MGAASEAIVSVLIPACTFIGILFAIFMWKRVSAISMGRGQSAYRTPNGREYLLEEEQQGEDEVITGSDSPFSRSAAHIKVSMHGIGMYRAVCLPGR